MGRNGQRGFTLLELLLVLLLLSPLLLLSGRLLSLTAGKLGDGERMTRHLLGRESLLRRLEEDLRWISLEQIRASGGGYRWPLGEGSCAYLLDADKGQLHRIQEFPSRASGGESRGKDEILLEGVGEFSLIPRDGELARELPVDVHLVLRR
jgi:prepilin-type N-terminal cleavage/methylation domain-containing protein